VTITYPSAPALSLEELAEDYRELRTNSAIQKIYLACFPHMLGAALQITGRREIAEDIATTKFIDIMNGNALERFVDRYLCGRVSSIKAYLVKSARNKAINYVRDEKIRSGIERRVAAAEKLDITDQFQFWEDPLLIIQLHNNINGLCPSEKVALGFYLEGYKQKEIGNKMGVTPSAAGVYVHRAKKNIMRKLNL
jgi:RNA polymerase sigma factor (sigma-70 family)